MWNPRLDRTSRIKRNQAEMNLRIALDLSERMRCFVNLFLTFGKLRANFLEFE